MHKQPTVPVNSRLYSSTFRFYGDLHLPPQGDMAGLFNNPRPYLPITQCQIFRQGVLHPPEQSDFTGKTDFLIIPKESVLWIASEPSSTAPIPERELRSLYLLYPDSDYVLKGEFPIAQNVRISDFLVRSFNERPFHYLYKAELRLTGQGKDLTKSPAIELFDIITVNLKKVAGVFDVAEDSSHTQFFGV